MKPKRRTSKSKRNMRRSHDALTPPTLSECPQCHEVKIPHQVCPSCGFYKGKEVIEIKEEK
ncbi:MAG: 50S ribosomal protein L32 [Nitrospinota bacterium]|jgi:large subunit ribosomal protein L32|nr:50S ribosomal protein L32 [Nitrospinota bacterium]|tara:strand:+ start:618 stop:800 length:183 start_codon:yes stop_codon:yes gene_type:complete